MTKFILPLIPTATALQWGVLGFIAVFASFDLKPDEAMPQEQRQQQVHTRDEKIVKKGVGAWILAGGFTGLAMTIFLIARPKQEHFEVVAEAGGPVMRAQRKAWALGVLIGVGAGLVFGCWYFPALDTTDTGSVLAPVRSTFCCILLAVSAGLITADSSARIIRRYGV